MLLHEANSRLKNQINVEQLEDIHDLYILLDLDKDIFCKIVDLVGVQKIIDKKDWYRYLLDAEWELRRKVEYTAAKNRLKELKKEERELLQTVAKYEEGTQFNT